MNCCHVAMPRRTDPGEVRKLRNKWFRKEDEGMKSVFGGFRKAENKTERVSGRSRTCITLIRVLSAAALVAAALCMARTGKAFAGDIFTRETTRLSYPSERTIAVKTPYLNKDIHYFSSDKDVATVGKDGDIMTVGAGTCTIYAFSEDGVKDECTVTVEEPGTPHRQIALTFDDGPDYWGQELLDYLASRNVKVTFFYIGNQVNNFKDNVYRAYNEGHEIGNHSWSHPNLSQKSAEAVTKELTDTNEAIFRVTGAYPTVFRPPYGARNNTVLEICNSPCILWSVDTRDWADRNADIVADRIVSGASDGAVILVHEIHKTTIAAAKVAIDRLLADGWEFVTISELFERDGGKLENGRIYNKYKGYQPAE